MCFSSGGGKTAKASDPAPAPAPPALPAQQTAIGGKRKKENKKRFGDQDGPNTRRDTSSNAQFTGGSGLRM